VTARCELSMPEADRLRDDLGKRLGDTSVPTLPEVAVRILSLVADPNACASDFTRIISADQSLTGRLLRLANSASFAQRKPVTSLDRAIVLLGLNRVKAMALGFHLSRAAAEDSGDFSFKQTWTRSLFRAHLALKMAEAVCPSASGEAFVVGLMADAGLPLMPKLVGPMYAQTIRPTDPPGLQYEREWRLLPMTHADVAAGLCRMWKLPAVLAEPIANHHERPATVDRKSPASVLHATAYIVGGLDLAQAHEPDAPPIQCEAAERLLGLDRPAIELITALAASEFEATRDFFRHVLDASISIDEILDRANHQLGIGDPTPEPADAPTPAVEPLRITAGTFLLELEPAPGGRVTVFVADAAGNRLLSETISPTRQTEMQIRQTLMLERADAEVMRRVMDGIRSLAA